MGPQYGHTTFHGNRGVDCPSRRRHCQSNGSGRNSFTTGDRRDLGDFGFSGLPLRQWARNRTVGILICGHVDLRATRNGRTQMGHIGAGLGLGALAATRPEGVLVGSLFCGAGLWYFGRRAWVGIAAFGVLVASMEWFRWSYYGAWVPNTFHAKPPNPLKGGVMDGTSLLWFGEADCGFG